MITTFRLLFIAALLQMTGCSGSGSHRINLMSAPEVYDSENINPFTDNDPVEWLPNSGVLYAIDRQPSAEGDSERYYRNERGHVLRLGMADIALGNGTLSWEEARPGTGCVEGSFRA